MKSIKFTLVFVSLIFFATTAFAQVYKWVDADGNVHFSDRPQDSAQGDEVDLSHINTMEGGDDLAASADLNKRKQADAQRKTAEAAAEAPDLCAEDLASYRRLSEMQYDENGKPFFFYRRKEDGSLMSQAEHEQYVVNLGNDLRRRGCL